MDCRILLRDLGWGSWASFIYDHLLLTYGYHSDGILESEDKWSEPHNEHPSTGKTPLSSCRYFDGRLSSQGDAGKTMEATAMDVALRAHRSDQILLHPSKDWLSTLTRLRTCVIWDLRAGTCVVAGLQKWRPDQRRIVNSGRCCVNSISLNSCHVRAEQRL